MSCNCKSKCCSVRIAWVFVIIGGINWGLTGLGMLIGFDLNLVHLSVGAASSMLEAIVYLFVGIASISSIMGCRCQKCRSNVCVDSSMVESKKSESPEK